MMSGVDVAGFVHTVVPLAIKITKLIIKAYDVYRSDEAHRDVDDMVNFIHLERSKFYI